MNTVVIRPGTKVSGNYKSPSADGAKKLSLHVEAIVRLDEKVYLVGTPEGALDWMRWAGLRPERFYAEGLSVETLGDVEVPEGLVIFGSPHPSFSQVYEAPTPLDLRAALASGGVRVTEAESLTEVVLATTPALD